MGFKMKGFPMMSSTSPMKQEWHPPLKPKTYWYKVNGKNVTYDEYKNAWKEGVEGRRPNLQTNHPDPFNIQAGHKKAREDLRKHTVLTEGQTKVKEK
tara:strand:- start:174 stop:464 length:291 start_codon:yes stop_codon:yes gene_type:complete